MTDVSPDETQLALESLLRWYAAMGADAAIDEGPHDRFVHDRPKDGGSLEAQALPGREAPGLKPPSSKPPSPREGEARAAHASADALIREAEARAAAAADLEALRESFATLPGLSLATSARMIFSGGTAGTQLMVFGGAPDTDDERQGETFAGPAGRLLDAMMRAIGLDRTGLYLANVVPWRPPGNRPPTSLELALCLPFARRHIALAAPRVILCLGERAAQPLLASADPISRLRGRWLSYEGDGQVVKLLATFSLPYLLSQPVQKRRAWADLQMLSAELAGPAKP